jgi:hypothetical protein
MEPIKYEAHDDVWIDNGVIVDGRGGVYGSPAEAREFALALLETANAYLPGIEQLIEASSLGTPEAKAARESVSEEDAQRIVDRANGV